jgi:hypothetical protein
MKQFCLGIIVAIGLTLPAFGQDVDLKWTPSAGPPGPFS